MAIQANLVRYSRITQIQRKIVSTEEEFIKTHKPLCFGKGRRFFYTEAPHVGVYGASNEYKFALTIERLELPLDRDFGDFGSGFGGITFTGGLYFRKAVGYEKDVRIFQEADRLKAELAFEKNVNFKNKDFLKADWSMFGVIFIFAPFWEGLELELAQKMPGVERGTIIIPLLAPEVLSWVMSSSHFQMIYPKSAADKRLPLFAAYERI